MRNPTIRGKKARSPCRWYPRGVRLGGRGIVDPRSGVGLGWVGGSGGHTSVGIGLAGAHEDRVDAAVRDGLQARPEVGAVEGVQLQPHIRRRPRDECLGGERGGG